MRKLSRSSQIEGLQELEGRDVVDISHDTHVELSSAAAILTGIKREFEISQISIQSRHYHIAVTPQVDTLGAIR